MAAGQKRPISTDISPFNVAEFGTGKPAETGARNPRIQALLYKIINDKSFTVKQMNNSAKYWCISFRKITEATRGGTKDEAAESTTMEDETREGKLKKIIRSTTDYLNEHNKKKLLELINEFRKDIGEDFLDIVQKLARGTYWFIYSMNS